MSQTSKQSIAALAIGAIGVVYGDIGTSPLYTIKTIFDPANGLKLEPASLIGILSLIFWSLMTVVSFKYVTLILRAHNHGEGGIMALLALASSSVADRPKLRNTLMLIGAFGAALFYGDGVITPAISVLSAVEGLEVATPLFKPYVVPITIALLVVLFVFQVKGTAGIGRVFGPIMVVWFVILAAIGVFHIEHNPAILASLNPLRAAEFCLHHRWIAFVALGSVVLAITGAEALYADMGHFGVKPIRRAWFALVFPALTLNYFGQGALLLANPQAIENPFYLMFPPWALYPMVILSSVATIIASQAVISGAFSMTQQAIRLGFLPRMQILHTSLAEVGQIYIPYLNWLLLVAVIMAVLGFGSSANLGAAYGVAVTGTMLITTLLTFFVVRYSWHYNRWLAIIATVFFFAIDATFFSANLLKIAQGGWFPIVIGLTIYTLMVTWKRGREILMAHLREQAIPLQPFLQSLVVDPPHRTVGTAVFMSSNPETTPHALMHNLAHNRVLHERVVFVTVVNHEVPRVADGERLNIRSIGNGCHQITVHYGFTDNIDIPAALDAAESYGMTFEPLLTSFFLSRETVVPTAGAGMAFWRERLFATMSRNAGSIAEDFHLPANRVIELGSRVEI